MPEYKQPPVIEVVCGILFEELSSLQAVHFGHLWDKLRPEYDHAREMPLLAPTFEALGRPPRVQIQLSELPPLPRTWLLTPSENRIVQIQRDRYLHNWKKVNPADEYPRYSTVIEMFRKRVETFEQFLLENNLGAMAPIQYEMTYVNHIPSGVVWAHPGDVGNVFPDFRWRADTTRFLPEPEQINWRTSFLLPNDQGRLHVTIRNMRRSADETPVVLLDLTARGMPRDNSREMMWSWFDLAHEWIVRSFTDLTSDEVRTDIWRQV